MKESSSRQQQLSTSLNTFTTDDHLVQNEQNKKNLLTLFFF